MTITTGEKTERRVVWRLPRAVSDATLGKVVWCELHGNFVTGQYTDVVLAHFTRDVGSDNVPIL
ncbi:MAG: hypothetical protein ACI8PT_003026 [Gammaproteobacteria bacterium]